VGRAEKKGGRRRKQAAGLGKRVEWAEPKTGRERTFFFLFFYPLLNSFERVFKIILN